MGHRRTAPWKLVLLGVAGAYVAVGAFGWFLGHLLIFRPPPPSYAGGDDLLMLPDGVGGRVAARWFETPGARLVVLLSHGNAEDLGQMGGHVRFLRDLGASVLVYDYPGYGRTGGDPSEAGAGRAADAAYDHLVKTRGIPPERIVLHGRSLGGGPTLWLASRRPCGGMILEACFVSAFRVATRWPLYPFDRFPNLDRIRAFEGPLLVLHGTEDEVIAPWHGQALYDAAAKADRRIVWIEGGRHDDLLQTRPERCAAAVRDLFERVLSR